MSMSQLKKIYLPIFLSFFLVTTLLFSCLTFVQAQTYNLPSEGDISYAAAGTLYRPWTKKELIIPEWINYANNHDGTHIKIGICSKTEEWDILAFSYGNPFKPCILIDAHLHGNEHYGYETILSILHFVTSNDPTAQQIRENNHIVFIPIANYRWARTNYYIPDGMTAKDSGADGSLHGVNLNRNFSPSYKSSLKNSNTDGNSGPYADSEKESQAIIYAWNHFKPRIYWSLHQGAGPYTNTISKSSQATTDLNKMISLIPSTASLIGANSNGKLISNLKINTNYGSGYSYDGAASKGIAAMMCELRSEWKYTPEIRNDLSNGETYKQTLTLFITACQAIQTPSTSTPAPTTTQSPSDPQYPYHPSTIPLPSNTISPDIYTPFEPTIIDENTFFITIIILASAILIYINFFKNKKKAK